MHIPSKDEELLRGCDLRQELVEAIDERTNYLGKPNFMHGGLKPTDDEVASGQIRVRRRIVQHAYKQCSTSAKRFVVNMKKLMTKDLIKDTHRILCDNLCINHADGSRTEPSKYAGTYRGATDLVQAGKIAETP